MTINIRSPPRRCRDRMTLVWAEVCQQRPTSNVVLSASGAARIVPTGETPAELATRSRPACVQPVAAGRDASAVPPLPMLRHSTDHTGGLRQREPNVGPTDSSRDFAQRVLSQRTLSGSYLRPGHRNVVC